MKLAVDIGNTHTVLGLVRDGSLVDRWRVQTRSGATADELWHQWKLVIDEDLPRDLRLLVASVVPDLSTEIRQLPSRYLDVEPWFLESPWEDAPVSVETANPESVGADRVAGAVKLYREFGPGLILDFGTATTIDVVNDGGSYEGGVIFPGIEASAIGLSSAAAKLPRVSPEEPDAFSYSDTNSGLLSGLYYGTAGAVERLMDELKDEAGFDGEVPVVATGGGAEAFTRFTDVITDVRPNLVLDGLRECYPG